MSRLRRPFLYDRYIFVTVDLLELRTRLQEHDYQSLTRSLSRMREKHGFVLTAWYSCLTTGTRLSSRRIRSSFQRF
jgi:hypothetical protein